MKRRVQPSIAEFNYLRKINPYIMILTKKISFEAFTVAGHLSYGLLTKSSIKIAKFAIKMIIISGKIYGLHLHMLKEKKKKKNIF